MTIICLFLLLELMVCKQIQRMQVPIKGNVREILSGEQSEKILNVPQIMSLLHVRRRGCKFIGSRINRAIYSG